MTGTPARHLRRSAVALAVLAACGQLAEATLLLQGRIAWPGGSGDLAAALLVGGSGVIGAGAAVAAERWRFGAAVVTGAGLLAVVVEAGAADPLLRMIPGFALLASGAALAIVEELRDGGPAWRGVRRWLASVSLTIHALLLLLLATLGLVVPLPGLLLLGALWVIGLLIALRFRTDRPGLVPVVVTLVVAIAVATLWIGGSWWGWGP